MFNNKVYSPRITGNIDTEVSGPFTPQWMNPQRSIARVFHEQLQSCNSFCFDTFW